MIELISKHLKKIFILFFLIIVGSSAYADEIKPNLMYIMYSFDNAADLNNLDGLEEYNYKYRHFKIPKNLVRDISKKYDSILKHKLFYEKVFFRGSKWIGLIRSKLKQNNIPSRIAELALIESHFQPYARSRSGAVGMWQMKLEAAAESDINVDFFTDERLNPYLSTDAAINYLKQLHKIFGSWIVSIAAYNAGPGAIKHLLKRHSFYDVIKDNLLPRETQLYIAKFFAFELAIYNGVLHYSPYEKYRLVKIKTHIPLYFLSRLMGISTNSLFKLNRFIKRRVLPPDHKSAEIIIPKSSYTIFKKNYDELMKPNPRKVLLYRVKKNDRWNKIARFFWLRKSTENSLKRKVKHLSAGMIIKIPWYVTQKRIAMLYKKSLPIRYEKYYVKRGDSLLKIAHRFGVTLASIRTVNRIKGSLIREKQLIIIEKRL